MVAELQVADLAFRGPMRDEADHNDRDVVSHTCLYGVVHLPNIKLFSRIHIFLTVS